MSDLKTAFEAITIYQTQYTQVDKLWGYFSVVTLAVCGFTIGGKPLTATLIEPLAIVLGYLVFCVGNHQALIAGQKQLEQLAAIAKTCAEQAQLDVSSIQPIPHQKIKQFHLTVIIAVTVGLLIVALIRTSQ